MKACFTINPNRKTEEFIGYRQLLEQNLYQGIEIFYPNELSKNEFETYTNNIKSLMDYPVEIVLHLPFGKEYDLCNLDTYQKTLQIIKDAIDYSKQFNVKKLTLHLGYVKSDRNVLFKHSVKMLQTLCDYAADANIMLENMPSDKLMGSSPIEVLNLIKETNRPNLKFIFDTGHAHLSKFPLENYIDLLKPYLYHIHISDNEGIKDEHKRIGLGNIDFKKMFTHLQDYQELCCLEIIYKDFHDLILFRDDLKKFE